MAGALLRADRGLVVATFVTLLLVPVLYAIVVLDLKIVTWTDQIPAAHSAATS